MALMHSDHIEHSEIWLDSDEQAADMSAMDSSDRCSHERCRGERSEAGKSASSRQVPSRNSNAEMDRGVAASRAENFRTTS